MIRAEQVTVRAGARNLLDRLAFHARPGQITAVVGPNGSGKTTLLRALAGEIPAEGQIRINDLDPRRARPWELAAIRAVLSQSTPVSFPFTALEVVRLGQSAGLGAAESDHARGLLARVGLGGYEGRLYQDLSGGEQSRVQMARVLAQLSGPPPSPSAPRWLLLDEPVASLDIGHQLMIMEIARDFADAGGGVVCVMHDLNLTAMFSDAVALIAGGRLLAQGAPDAVLTDALLSQAYGCRIRVNSTPRSGCWLLPQMAERACQGH